MFIVRGPLKVLGDREIGISSDRSSIAIICYCSAKKERSQSHFQCLSITNDNSNE